MASPIDRAFVEILPDFSKFVNGFKKDIDKATSTLEARFDRTFAKIERMASVSARSIVEKFRDAFAQMSMDADRAAERAEDALDGINPDDVDVDVDVDPDQVDDEVDAAVRRANPPDIPINIDLDREGVFSKFLSSITGIRLPVAGFTALAAALAAGAASAVQFAAALAPAVGIIATLPSGIGTLAAGISTLQVATMGVGDAFAAAFEDAETFDAAMEGLAPNVQAAAQTLRDMAPALDEFRDKVQQAFFQDFDTVLNSLAEALLGPVTDGMVSVADAINGVVQSLTGVATSQEGIDFVTQSFAVMAQVIATLQEPLTLLFSSLLSVGTAINDAFGESAGAGLAGLITQFATFLETAAASGQAVAWVENAMTVFQQLGAIISPIVGIIASIGNAAQITGGNILGVFGEALGAFSAFLESAEGTSVVIGVFQTLNSVGALFGDVLAGIGPGLVDVIGGVSALVGAITPLIPPLAIIVGNLLTALAPLFTAVAQAISPLIGPITTIAGQIGGFLVVALEALMPWIEMLLDLLSGQLANVLEIISALLGALLPIFEALTPLIEPLIAIMTPFIELFAWLADLLASILVPVIQFLGDILLWLVENVIVPILMPILEQLAAFFEGPLSTAINWLVEQFKLAGLGIEVIWNFIKDLIISNAEQMQEQWNRLANAFKAGWDIINNNVIQPFIQGFNIVKNSATNRINEIKTGFNTFVSFMKAIPGKVSGALGSIFDPLWNGFRSAINSVISGWNNLSFTMPSVDLGPLGSTPGFTVSTPNIPSLDVGGLSMGEGLVNMHPNEAVLPLEDQRTTTLLSEAITNALNNISGLGDAATAGGSEIVVNVYLDGEQLTSRIDTRIDANNQQMLRRARSGTRRNH